MNTKCNYMHVDNINMTMIEIPFFVKLSDSKHRLLRLCINPYPANVENMVTS